MINAETTPPAVWTPELEEKLEALWRRDDMRTPAIVAALGFTQSQVYGKAEKMKLGRRPALNIATLPPRRSPGPWTPALEQQLAALWTDGVPTKDIGRALGFSKSAVIGKAARLQLKHRPSPLAGRRSLWTAGLNDHQLAIYSARRRRGVLPVEARAEALRT